jgi:pimeloyl-ACP methyl ester carboxylesterase
MALELHRWGDGPPVLLVHGSVTGGESTWAEQRPLAERWQLIVLERPGFGRSPSTGKCDFEADAPLVAELLGDGAHLVGHSYGGVVSLLAAALNPSAVWSLTVIEPPAFGVAQGFPAVDAFVATLKDYWRDGPDDPDAFLRGFLKRLGSRSQLPRPLPPAYQQGAEMLKVERGPWEANIPFEQLSAAPFRKLVVSGAHNPAFDAVCDVMEERLAAERAVIPGSGHGVQRTGAPFNSRLEEFLSAV